MYYEDSKEPGPADDSGNARPPQIPEKFWDPNTGAVRTDALLRAYQDLERRMHSMVKVPSSDSSDEDVCCFRRAMGIPDSPDGYEVQTTHPMFGSDGEVNKRLHDAGFTARQAQLVYDLAHERVVPVLDNMTEEHQTRRHLDRLKDHFGGDARWSEVARQVAAWGKKNLSQDVYESLARSPEGVMALERMMASGEPAMGRQPSAKDEPLSEAELKKMMQDPRYWKRKDSAFIDKVSSGFRRLYGEE